MDAVKGKSNGILAELFGSFILGGLAGAFLLYVNVQTLQVELTQIRKFIARIEKTAILPEADRRTTRLTSEMNDVLRRVILLEAFATKGGRFTAIQGEAMATHIREVSKSVLRVREEYKLLEYRLSELEHEKQTKN